jgi:POT family proton-dependent oligopeptide transporter
VDRVLDVYSRVGWIAMGLGVAMMVIAPLIRRLMHLETLGDTRATAEARSPTPPVH